LSEVGNTFCTLLQEDDAAIHVSTEVIWQSVSCGTVFATAFLQEGYE
jgi:hypothetical protein